MPKLSISCSTACQCLIQLLHQDSCITVLINGLLMLAVLFIRLLRYATASQPFSIGALPFKPPTFILSCSYATVVADDQASPGSAYVQVYYDPKETGYDKLLDCFFEHVDPTTANRQGNDVGTQYRSGIYYHNEEQKAAAEKVLVFYPQAYFVSL